jgi:hypothetical protein
MKYATYCLLIVLGFLGLSVMSSINEYVFFAGFVILQFVILATAWNILGGYAGYVNFGVPAFIAMGAYTAVVLFKSISAPLVVQIIGGGILAGLNTLQNEFIGWTHADLQTDPVDIIEIKLISGSANQFLKGTRRKRRFLDQAFTSGMSFAMSFLFLTRLSDINAQPSVVSRDLFEKWSRPPSDFSLDLYAFVAARRESAYIRRFPVDFSTRYAGDSKWNNGFMARIKMTQRTIAYARKLRRDLSK